MADLGTATIQCTLGAGYIDTSEAERLEGEIAGKDKEIAALEAKIVELNGKIETAKADVLADFASVIDRTIVNLELPEGLTVIGDSAFEYCRKLTHLQLHPGLTKIASKGCADCYTLEIMELPATLETIQEYAFFNDYALATVTFNGKPASLGATAFKNCWNLTIINVPWAEGEVSGAPWGATNATINYNYTGGEA